MAGIEYMLGGEVFALTGCVVVGHDFGAKVAEICERGCFS